MERPKARASAFFALADAVSAAATGGIGAIFAADAVAAAGALISGAGAPFFVCFAITSRRCCSRRRSSRQARKAFRPRVAPPCAPAVAAAKNRPKENCVDMMVASTIRVSTTITEPVLFRYSDIWCARNSPA